MTGRERSNVNRRWSGLHAICACMRNARLSRCHMYVDPGSVDGRGGRRGFGTLGRVSRGRFSVLCERHPGHPANTPVLRGGVAVGVRMCERHHYCIVRFTLMLISRQQNKAYNFAANSDEMAPTPNSVRDDKHAHRKTTISFCNLVWSALPTLRDIYNVKGAIVICIIILGTKNSPRLPNPARESGDLKQAGQANLSAIPAAHVCVDCF